MADKEDTSRRPDISRDYDPRGRREGAGSQSRSDLYTDKHRMEHGFEMDSATSVGGSDVDEEYERLQEVNAGAEPSDGEWSIREADRDIARITASLCSTLDLNVAERDEVVAVMDELELSFFGSLRGIETVALGVIRFRVSQMRSERVDPIEVDDDDMDRIFISRQDQFRELMEDYDVSTSDLNTVSEGVKEQLPNYVIENRAAGSAPIPFAPDPNLPQTRANKRPDEWWESQLEGEHGLADKPVEYWQERVPEQFIEAIPEQYRHHIPEECR